MSTLPDLSTDNIGMMAYWNAISQGGVDSIDPMETLERFNEYTAYDNGIEGEIAAINKGRSVMCRIKTDGWIILYFDGTNEYNQRASSRSSAGAGLWEVLSNWASGNASFSMFETRINNIRQEFSNGGNMTWSSSDVGYDCPQYPSATNIDLYSFHSGNSNGSWSITPDLPKIHYFAAVGKISPENFTNRHLKVSDQSGTSTTLAVAKKTHSGGGAEYGSINILNEGYQTNEELVFSSSGEYSNSQSGQFFILWE